MINNNFKASIALEDLLNNDQNLSIEDLKLINNAWRKAEAYHFFMLSNKQFYQGFLINF